ncbi:MAG: PHP domain-containing protein [Candidatus Sigynarchaeota archaeon]
MKSINTRITSESRHFWHMAPKRMLVLFFGAVFVAWVVILIVFAALSRRDPLFFDALGQVDVSAQYVSEIPMTRYIFEPFAGIVFILFVNPYDALVAIPIGYAIARVAQAFFTKVLMRGNQKVAIFARYARDFVAFLLKYTGIGLLVGAVILFIGWAIAGAHFFMTSYMLGLHIISWYAIVLIAIKVVHHAVVFCHPRMALKEPAARPWASLPKTSPKYHAFKALGLVGREARYALAGIVLVMVGFFTLASAVLPNYTIRTTLAPNEYLFDLHVHTWYSDGSLSPQQRVDWYIQQGIHGAAFTDHEGLKGALEAKAYVEQNHLDFTVIIGQEYTDLVNDIHLNIYGTLEQFAPLDQANPMYPDIHFLNVSDCIIAAKAAGAFVTVNHYSGSPGTPYRYDELHAWGVDGFEIVNGGTEHSSAIREYCLNHGLACLGGTDEHMNGDVNTLVRVSMMNPSNLTELFTVLKMNTHQVVLVDYMTNPLDIGGRTRQPNPIRPFVNYFLNLDGAQIGSWFAWSGISFTAFIAFFVIVKKNPFNAI